MPSASQETLPLICEENREELARLCGVSGEDVVMTWVSEMQGMVSRDVTSHDYFRFSGEGLQAFKEH